MSNKNKYIYVIVVIIFIVIGVLGYIWISEGGLQSNKPELPIKITNKSTNEKIDDLSNLRGPITLQFDLKKDMDYIGNYMNISDIRIDFDGDGKDDIISSSDFKPSFTFKNKGKYQPKGWYKGVDKITGGEKEVEIKIPEINISE